MCDPVTLSIMSTVAGAVGTGMNAMGAMNAQKKQANEVNLWQDKQRRFREQEQARQESLRQEATTAQQQGLEQIGAQDQAKRQTDEEARLNQYLTGQAEASQAGQETGGAPISVADKSLSGQSGGDPAFQTDLAKKISEAMSGAKQRIGALARVTSYGGSFKGLGTENPLLQQATGAAIDRPNEFRRGSLGAFNVERAIDPVEVTYQPSPLGDIFSDALAAGSQGLGNAAYGGNTFPSAPKAKKWFGPPKPLTGKYSGAVGLF